ncbi:hypothetical protein BDN72DRAFT_937289 [Pluteus cervinus]|uniref:Uncharacterized protein n=1 Tax=Pluteus cervinus TaxID=181527 RepID=A0ACD3A5W5_9AGAR|nr:hypothetical protein BDN72DRAFT_937289 [Pluteus cervinus]
MPGRHHRHDLFDGQEALLRISAKNAQTQLPYFIAYALHRTKLNEAVTYAALTLKAHFPTAKGLPGHRLFISAIMIASKVLCNDTYSNKSLWEINQMERENWELNVDTAVLGGFKDKVSQDFSSDKPPNQYPKYDVAMMSKRSARVQSSQSATPLPDPSTTTNAIPNFGSRNSTPSKLQSQSRSSSYDSPTTPDTPSPSLSNSTSPTTSPEPLTPRSTDDCNARIHGQDQSPRFSCVPKMSTTHPLKMKMFAQTVGTTW